MLVTVEMETAVMLGVTMLQNINICKEMRVQILYASMGGGWGGAVLLILTLVWVSSLNSRFFSWKRFHGPGFSIFRRFLKGFLTDS